MTAVPGVPAGPWPRGGRDRRRPPPCHAVRGAHSLTRARLYPSGWLCDRHSPWHRAGLPDPTRHTTAPRTGAREDPR